MFRARGDVARVSALLGDWTKADGLYATTPRDEAERSFVWFLRARLAMWRSDAAWAASARKQMTEPSFPLASVVDAICDGIVNRSAPEPVLQVIESMGKVTGRVRRRPIFFRQLRAEVLAHAGDAQGALAAIEEAAQLGLIDLVWLDRCPLFVGLREIPSFLAARAVVNERASRVLEAFT